MIVEIAEAEHVNLIIQVFLWATARPAPGRHAISICAVELFEAVEGAAVLKIYYFKSFVSLGASDVDVTLIRFPLFRPSIILYYLLFIKEWFY